MIWRLNITLTILSRPQGISHRPIMVYPQNHNQTVNCWASIDGIFEDLHSLATWIAHFIWYFTTDWHEDNSDRSGGLFSCFNLSVNILSLALFTDAHLKPYILHTNSSKTSNISCVISLDMPNSWNSWMYFSSFTIFFYLAVLPFVKNDET